MYKKYYQHFLKGHGELLHFAAHSHHFWPDVARQAMLEAFDEAAELSDRKWNHFYSTHYPNTQKTIASFLQLKESTQIAFAPNTHELLTRLFSSFAGQKSLKVLTTDSEFHSFKRQITRMSELDGVEVDVVKCDDELESNLIEKASSKKYDVIFVSQVFFNSGKSLGVDFFKKLESAKDTESLLVIDGYHGFCAIPTDLSELEGKIYYLAGGYKYAQAGEGVCFMVIPKDCKLRPLYTGWFADFAGLDSESNDKVSYSNDGFRFAGSTIDITGFYRFNAVWEQFKRDHITIDQIDNYVRNLQKIFLESFPGPKSDFIETDLSKVGHFLSLDCKSSENAKNIHDQLLQHSILTDYRGSTLRFGFAPYQDESDIETLISRLNKVFF